MIQEQQETARLRKAEEEEERRREAEVPEHIPMLASGCPIIISKQYALDVFPGPSEHEQQLAHSNIIPSEVDPARRAKQVVYQT